MRLFANMLVLALAAGVAAAQERPPLDTYAPARPFAEALWTPAAPATAPAATLTRLADGAPLALAAIDGPAVLVFWATWCPVCGEEMPGVAGFAERLAAAGGRLHAVAVDAGPEAAAKVRRHLEARGLEALPTLHDPTHAAAGALGLRGVPTTVFLDAEGRVRGLIEGRARWTEPALLDYALGAPVPAEG